MWKIGAVLAIAVIAGAIEMPSLIRRSAKEAAVYGIMLSIGAALSVVAIQLADLPSPLNVLAYVFKPVNAWLGKVFG
jgi:ABC-type Mn2+/Zn2+ transport system permease subunit